jgi:hypothetical protein
MAYEIVSEISYIGADDMSVLDDISIMKIFKMDSNLIDPINIVDDLEVADGFNGWALERVSDSVIQHTGNWDSEEQYDTWKATWGEITIGVDWSVARLETAS